LLITNQIANFLINKINNIFAIYRQLQLPFDLTIRDHRIRTSPQIPRDCFTCFENIDIGDEREINSFFVAIEEEIESFSKPSPMYDSHLKWPRIFVVTIAFRISIRVAQTNRNMAQITDITSDRIDNNMKWAVDQFKMGLTRDHLLVCSESGHLTN